MTAAKSLGPGQGILGRSIGGFFDPLLAFLEGVIREKFMDPRHREMWCLADSPADVVTTIRNAPSWGPEARDFALV